ncbi:MAG: pantoate--beta-alanine ligase [Candidatus Omnitrophota bacterium]|nr:MAG: pantoate--beta-alanine ligase [Candidatus Omnitrophota bacterium]
MRVIHSIKKMSAYSSDKKLKKKIIGFVPTMGALHEGHLSLIRKARQENDVVIVSIFVNPAQFGPTEDFKKYPRNFQHDVYLCRKENVDAVFYPKTKEIYPSGYSTYIEVEGLSNILCGRFRPGHFKGVATIVAKLFNIVKADNAYFGQKDAQQAVIIKKMVQDLNMPVKIKVMPIIREIDGLALSSRNAYLNPQERQAALVLFTALNRARRLIKNKVKDSRRIIKDLKGIIKKNRSAKIDYIAVVDPDDLAPLDKVKNKALIALAVHIGKTRLIDNIVVNCN